MRALGKGQCICLRVLWGGVIGGWCMCMYVHRHVWVHVHVCAYAWRGQKTVWGVIPQETLFTMILFLLK